MALPIHFLMLSL